MANRVEFFIKVSDNGSIKHVEADTEELGKALNDVKQDAEKLNSEVVNWAQTAQAVESFQQTVNSLKSAMSGLTQTYQQQLVAETQLSTVMKQRMGVTDAEVNSIKELCSAQQELGVIGDEVQISGAQQMATFLNEKSSLDALIPAMNNLLAQQKGLNATQQDAVSIGNMMGKAMQGQVDVLQRVGITFTDAQKSILKYGDESQRAAVLAEVIRDNVGDMNAELAATDAGKQKQLENTLGDIEEKLGGIAQKIMPMVTVAAGLVTVASGALKAAASIKAMASAFDLARMKAIVLSVNEKMVAMAQRLLAASGYTAAAGTTALTVATVALYAALTMGISLVIEGLVALFYSLSDSASDAADAERDAADAAQEVENARKREESTLTQVRSQLEIYISRLKNFKGTKEEEKKLVNELNDTYGTTMGYFSSVSQWYNALIQNSKAYCDQMVIEARTRMLADRIAQKEQENYDIRYDESGKLKKYSTTRDTQTVSDGLSYETGLPVMKYKKVEVVGTSDLDKANDKIKQNNAAIQNYKNQLQEATKASGKIQMPVMGAAAPPSGSSGNGRSYNTGTPHNTNTTHNPSSNTPTLIADAQSYKDLGNNIKYYQDKLDACKPTETEAIEKYSQQIRLLKEKQAAVKAAIDKAGLAEELDTLGKIDEAIAYQRSLRTNASQQNLTEIDSEIERLNNLRTAFEENAHTAVPIDKITTYQQISDEISHLDKRLKTATASERSEIQKQINALKNLQATFEEQAHTVVGINQIHTYEELDAEIGFYEAKLKRCSETERAEVQKQIIELQKLRKEWDDSIEALQVPEDISKLNTIEKLEEAISYYGTQQKRQSSDEVVNTQKTILALEKKRDALSRLLAIPSMQEETAELGGLEGKKLKLELEAIGLDGIKGKIKELQKMLDDTKNPLGEQEREQVMGLVNAYQHYEQILKKSQVKLQDAWGSIKGLGSGIESITDALEGNGNAWKTVTGIMDGVMQLYESINGIVSIVEALTGASTAHTTVKIAEAGAEEAESATAVAAGATAVTTSIATAAAITEETAAWSALAAAKTFAAHASIPFVGTGTAAGFVATQQSIIAACAIPKFANGAIAYGPTLGLFGEYAGASTNPEVVAPLDRLQSLLDIDGKGSQGGKVKFKIKGRSLEGVLEKEHRIKSRR